MNKMKTGYDSFLETYLFFRFCHFCQVQLENWVNTLNFAPEKINFHYIYNMAVYAKREQF